LNEELEILNVEARGLEETIAENVAMLLEQNFRDKALQEIRRMKSETI
jgi:hypothetical protein